jgi:hypothetical protein
VPGLKPLIETALDCVPPTPAPKLTVPRMAPPDESTIFALIAPSVPPERVIVTGTTWVMALLTPYKALVKLIWPGFAVVTLKRADTPPIVSRAELAVL